MKKRLMAMLLSAAMILTLLPTIALADGDDLTVNPEKDSDKNGSVTFIYGDEAKTITVENDDNGWNSDHTYSIDVTESAKVVSVSKKSTGEISRNGGTATFTITPLKVGKATVKVSRWGASATVSVTVNPKEITPSVALKDQEALIVYDGSEQKPEVVVTYKVNQEDEILAASEYTVDYTNNIDAGTATVTVTPKEGGNYAFEPVSTEFTIKKAFVGFLLESRFLDFTGEPQALVNVVEAPKVGTLTFSLEEDGVYTEDIPTATDPGDYIVYWKFTPGEDANYEDFDNEDMLSGKLDYTEIAWPTIAKTVTYGETDGFFGSTYVHNNWSVVVGENIVDCEKDNTLGTYVHVTGKGVGKAVVKHTNPYYAPQIEYFTVDVDPKPVTVSGITAESKVYDGDTEATLNYTEAQFSGMIAGDDLSVTATGAFGDKNVGTDKTVTISNITLGGTDVANYVLAENGNQSETTATITAKPVTVSGITAENKVYDGDTEATLNYTEAQFSGMIAGDDLSVTATGAFGDKNVGTDKTVTISNITLGGTDVANYVLAENGNQSETTATITAKPATVSGITAENKVYDGDTEATLNYTEAQFSGMIAGDDLSVTATGAFGDKNVGTDKTVTISNITLGGTDVANYVLAENGNQSETTANINPKSVTLAWQWDGAAFPVSITYDGKEHAVSATSSDFIQGDNVALSVTCDTAKNAAAYTATATLTDEDAGNYTLSNGTQKFTINPKQQSSSSSGSGGSVSTPTVTVPVSGESSSVKIDASVSGSTAAVKELKSTDAAKVAGGNIEIDLSGLNKTITAAKIPEKTVDQIADKGNLSVKLSTATVTFDAKATESISGQTAAGGLELKVEANSGSTAKLTAKQQEAIKGEEIDAQVVVNVSMLSGGKAVSSFNGGNATLKVPYTLKKDQSASGLCVYFIGNSGEVEKLPCFYVNGEVVFTVEHFSDYVIAYDAVAATACPKDLTCLLSQFPDLRTTSWYHDGIHYCLEKGLMNGMPGGLFQPSGDTTRAQATSMLWRVMGSPAVNYELNFSDVRHGCWYEEAVRWATSEGIINGVNDTDFAPTDPVTREQFASMLYRLAQIKGEKFDGEWTLDFSDLARMRAWAHDAASWCNQKGIMAGLPDGTFQPRGNTTRAQAASMIQRFNEIILGK